MRHIVRFARIASAIGRPINLERATVLDFGCGSGAAVAEERSRGLGVFGCDLPGGLDSAPRDLIEQGVLRTVEMSGYRIPFDNDEFDMVVSNEVLEHVQNHEEAFREIRRVLKPTGISIHIFPSRHTPVEPHVFVPLATMIRSMSWLRLWAYVGIRNEYQKDLSAENVAGLNREYFARIQTTSRRAASGSKPARASPQWRLSRRSIWQLASATAHESPNCLSCRSCLANLSSA